MVGLAFNIFYIMYNISMSSVSKYSKYKNVLLQVAVFCFIFFTPFLSLYAADCPVGHICNPIGVNDLNGLIKTGLEGIIKIGAPLVAFAIIYAGFLFVFAQGNSEKLDKAKETLLYTLIGAALLLGSWAIAQIISNTVSAIN